MSMLVGHMEVDSALGDMDEEGFYNPASHIASFTISIPAGQTLGIVLSGEPGCYEGLMVVHVHEDGPAAGLLRHNDRIIMYQVNHIGLINAELSDDEALAIVKQQLRQKPHSIALVVLRENSLPALMSAEDVDSESFALKHAPSLENVSFAALPGEIYEDNHGGIIPKVIPSYPALTGSESPVLRENTQPRSLRPKRKHTAAAKQAAAADKPKAVSPTSTTSMSTSRIQKFAGQEKQERFDALSPPPTRPTPRTPHSAPSTRSASKFSPGVLSKSLPFADADAKALAEEGRRHLMSRYGDMYRSRAAITAPDDDDSTSCLSPKPSRRHRARRREKQQDFDRTFDSNSTFAPPEGMSSTPRKDPLIDMFRSSGPTNTVYSRLPKLVGPELSVDNELDAYVALPPQVPLDVIPYTGDVSVDSDTLSEYESDGYGDRTWRDVTDAQASDLETTFRDLALVARAANRVGDETLSADSVCSTADSQISRRQRFQQLDAEIDDIHQPDLDLTEEVVFDVSSGQDGVLALLASPQHGGPVIEEFPSPRRYSPVLTAMAQDQKSKSPEPVSSAVEAPAKPPTSVVTPVKKTRTRSPRKALRPGSVPKSKQFDPSIIRSTADVEETQSSDVPLKVASVAATNSQPIKESPQASKSPKALRSRKSSLSAFVSKRTGKDKAKPSSTKATKQTKTMSSSKKTVKSPTDQQSKPKLPFSKRRTSSKKSLDSSSDAAVSPTKSTSRGRRLKDKFLAKRRSVDLAKKASVAPGPAGSELNVQQSVDFEEPRQVMETVGFSEV